MVGFLIGAIGWGLDLVGVFFWVLASVSCIKKLLFQGICFDCWGLFVKFAFV